ncbi:terpene cyclase [Steccherinum ochraceum]|uniref:Terpene synthase n=1 Tax=Steccherinum ochraceum TaxID=92696 RepID=A0A4V2MV13_9APHY|nr:terpene cyclase [Steccherinum ochraceum]
MNLEKLQPFPSRFVLQDLTSITSRVFPLKINPLQEEAYKSTRAWFVNLGVYSEPKQSKFLLHRFDLYAGLSFSEADLQHLDTCIAFFLWAFSFDDLSDEGELQSKPERVQVGVDISMRVLNDPSAPAPALRSSMPRCFTSERHLATFPRRATASPGACNRFYRAVESWMKSQVEQAQLRFDNNIPSVEDFILLRRRTIGGEIVEAMVEYSLDIKIPEWVWDHPILVGMSHAVIDVMTWPNDLISFNKEQSDNDYQNLVVCVMLQHNTDLQGAVDIVTKMLAQRVADYANLKKQLPSFGPEIDGELARYLTALEQYTQGTVVWYYDSPRYFRGIDLSNKHDLIIPVYPPSTDAPRPWTISREKPVDRTSFLAPSALQILFIAAAIISLLLWQFFVPSMHRLQIALVSS